VYVGQAYTDDSEKKERLSFDVVPARGAGPIVQTADRLLYKKQLIALFVRKSQASPSGEEDS